MNKVFFFTKQISIITVFIVSCVISLQAAESTQSIPSASTNVTPANTPAGTQTASMQEILTVIQTMTASLMPLQERLAQLEQHLDRLSMLFKNKKVNLKVKEEECISNDVYKNTNRQQ